MYTVHEYLAIPTSIKMSYTKSITQEAGTDKADPIKEMLNYNSNPTTVDKLQEKIIKML